MSLKYFNYHCISNVQAIYRNSSFTKAFLDRYFLLQSHTCTSSRLFYHHLSFLYTFFLCEKEGNVGEAGARLRHLKILPLENSLATLNMHFPLRSLPSLQYAFSRRPSGSETAVLHRDLFERLPTQSGPVVEFFVSFHLFLPLSLLLLLRFAAPLLSPIRSESF